MLYKKRMEFDVPISVTHKIDNSVLRNKWPEDLSIHTLRFFPKQSGNTLPALSFLAPRSTGESICEHMHDTEDLIGYLQNKHESAHACPQCEIEGRIGDQNGGKKKKPKVEIEIWERPASKELGPPSPRRFTTEVYDPENKGALYFQDVFGTLPKFCDDLEAYSLRLFKNRNEKERHWLILAKDITNQKNPIVVGFAFFTEKIGRKAMILGGLNREDLERIFHDNEWTIPKDPDDEERWKDGASIILDYMSTRTKLYGKFRSRKNIDTTDPDYGEYKEKLENLTQVLMQNLVWVNQDPNVRMVINNMEAVAHWMLTYKAIILKTKVFEEALIFVTLICADPKYKGMGVSKGIFRRLQKRVIEVAEAETEETMAAIELEPVEKQKDLYRFYGFVPVDWIEMEGKEIWTSGNLMVQKLNIAISDPNKNIDPNIN